MNRYKADPGSIFEMDNPTDTETGTHRAQIARPSSRLTDILSEEEDDYELLAHWDANKLRQQTSGSWQNYLTASFKKVYTLSML